MYKLCLGTSHLINIGLTIDGSLGGDVNSTSLLELDSDGDGDTPT